MKQCSKCGKKVEDAYNFCTSCGTPKKSNITHLFKNIPRKRIALISLGLVIILLISGYMINENRKFNEARKAIGDYKTNKMVNEYLLKPKTSDLQIEKGWRWEKDGDYIYIRGSLKNISKKNISYFEILAEFLDDNGNVIDSGWTNDADDFKPNTSRKFEIIHRYDGNFKRIRLEVSEVS